MNALVAPLASSHWLPSLKCTEPETAILDGTSRRDSTSIQKRGKLELFTLSVPCSHDAQSLRSLAKFRHDSGPRPLRNQQRTLLLVGTLILIMCFHCATLPSH
jgi:hypothetical protein